MFHYTRGTTLGFKTIADMHYKGLQAIRNHHNGNRTFFAQSVIERAEKYAKGNGINANFFKDLIANNNQLLEKIITGDNNELLSVIKEFKKKQNLRNYPQLRVVKTAGGKVDPKCFYRMVQHVFDYDTFVDKASRWNAYHLTEVLGIKVCVYCNRNYTYTLTKPHNIVRPELDHFLPKSEYPYLALSFYNLVPSCHICNSNLKHKTPFDHEKYLHPYDYSIDAVVQFSIKLRSKNDEKLKDEKKNFGIQFFYGNLDSFDLVLKTRGTTLTQGTGGKLNTKYFRKILNNIEVFKILELYNEHKDLVVEMIQTARLYDDAYVDQLFSTYKGQLFRTREDVLRMITRNYHLTEEMPNRPFSKLTKDVFEELGLTYILP